MKTRKIIGYSILAAVFLGVYVGMAFAAGPLVALIPFAVVGLVALGAMLIA